MPVSQAVPKLLIRLEFTNRFIHISSLIRKGEKIKFNYLSNIEGLFKVIDKCEGKVELVTPEGDRLNLKSKLSQYVSMANIFSDGTISELEILAYEAEDITKLVNFMMND